MLETTTAEINGTTYTIGKLPAHLAFETACVVAEWHGQVLSAAGSSGLVAEAAGSNGPDAIASLGRTVSMTAKMLRDKEYRTLVWDRVLGMCSVGGVGVLRDDWTSTFAGDRLADLYLLHQQAIRHSCGAFLRALGAGGVEPPSASE